jgi:hypothetical protein
MGLAQAIRPNTVYCRFCDHTEDASTQEAAMVALGQHVQAKHADQMPDASQRKEGTVIPLKKKD